MLLHSSHPLELPIFALYSTFLPLTHTSYHHCLRYAWNNHCYYLLPIFGGLILDLLVSAAFFAFLLGRVSFIAHLAHGDYEAFHLGSYGRRTNIYYYSTDVIYCGGGLVSWAKTFLMLALLTQHGSGYDTMKGHIEWWHVVVFSKCIKSLPVHIRMMIGR